MTSVPPFTPDAEEARRLLLDELSGARYEAARPTLFDRLVQGFVDWITGLQAPGGDGTGAVAALVVVILVAALIIVTILLVGRPRLNRASSVPRDLFGKDDGRSASEIRAAAEAAAAAADWPTAIEERFRAIARAAAERSIVTTSPGTTATAFAARAADAFPASATSLHAAARAFDEVRYLDRPGSAADYEALRQVDVEIAGSRPQLRAARATSDAQAENVAGAPR